MRYPAMAIDKGILDIVWKDGIAKIKLKQIAGCHPQCIYDTGMAVLPAKSHLRKCCISSSYCIF
jgi:hypothetical protein